jgi:hypothetical protein
MRVAVVHLVNTDMTKTKRPPTKSVMKSFWLAPEELKTINHGARTAGVSFSDFVRTAAVRYSRVRALIHERKGQQQI